eukprot:gnl/TRDRNA2_/TRDRNA2_202207_c0_seq1.p1 gnl/TRDRNA2_/TRDRNA2_202207_c0~~gnl/TRDRNA2_/TRDRNA2_202207_c0_seq1.p1  ORF type:complete len:357 (+),score=29.24 gnl/TRDRNA2_/TRDRNA2_202207_c0_seq1:20-1090(+)
MFTNDKGLYEDLMDMITLQSLHPGRTSLLSAEPDDTHETTISNQGRLRSRAMKGNHYDLVEAVDAQLILLLLQDNGEIGRAVKDPLKCTLPRSTKLGAYEPVPQYQSWSPGASPPKLKIPDPSDARTGLGKYPQPYEYMHLVIEGIWRAVDHDQSGTLDMGEARELLRTVVSRPLLAFLVHKYLIAKYPESERAWTREEALVAASNSAYIVITDATHVAKTMWLAMDADNDGTITAEEFKTQWAHIIPDHILPQMEEAAHGFLEAIKHDTNPNKKHSVIPTPSEVNAVPLSPTTSSGYPQSPGSMSEGVAPSPSWSERFPGSPGDSARRVPLSSAQDFTLPERKEQKAGRCCCGSL